MSDGVVTYTAGGTATYTIVVTNYGPSNVAAAVIDDTRPAQLVSWSWTCTPQLGASCLAGTRIVTFPSLTPSQFRPEGVSRTR